MKRLSLIFGFVLLNATSQAISSFALPWMNSPDGGTATYYSVAIPAPIFIIEAYFLGCHYCNDNAPNVNRMASKYANEPRVQVLDMGVDDADSDYRTWIERHHPNHPVLKDANRKVIKQLGTLGYPSTYVVDCHGKVVYDSSGVWGGEEERAIQTAIDKLLKEQCFL